jgi:hypothetical protein
VQVLSIIQIGSVVIMMSWSTWHGQQDFFFITQLFDINHQVQHQSIVRDQLLGNCSLEVFNCLLFLLLSLNICWPL